jgi:phosphoglycerate dehydrogenase-like enzyme
MARGVTTYMASERQILVLNQAAHGDPVSTYVTELRSRLPECEIAFAETPRVARESIDGARIVTGLSLSEELLDAADRLEWFACIAAGTDHLPLKELEERGVVVTNASGVHGPNMAEYVLGAMTAFTHRFHDAWERNQREEWRHFRGGELYGSTVTIVGLGAVGTALTERISGYGVDTIGVRYTPLKGGPTDEVMGFDTDDFHEALTRTDHLALCCPLTDTTRGLISDTELEILPSDGTIVNVGRGGLVDTDALTAAVQNNKVGAVALDVTDPEPLPRGHPLWACQNVMITPHVSGYTPEYYSRLADIVAKNVSRLNKSGSYDETQNRVV